jgi:hypothetical protein
MSCPIADYTESGMDMVKLAGAYALFVHTYIATFSLSSLRPLTGLSIKAANRLLTYSSQLLSYPIGCVLANYNLALCLSPLLCSLDNFRVDSSTSCFFVEFDQQLLGLLFSLLSAFSLYLFGVILTQKFNSVGMTAPIDWRLTFGAPEFSYGSVP